MESNAKVDTDSLFWCSRAVGKCYLNKNIGYSIFSMLLIYFCMLEAIKAMIKVTINQSINKLMSK